jgi:hypothetical protein
VLDDYAPLADRGVEIEARVKPDEVDEAADQLVAEFEEYVEPLIPRLLALAEVSRRVEVDQHEAARRWSERRIRRVDDAFVEYVAHHGDQYTATANWLKERYDDALFLPGESPAIVFDTHPGEDRLPPLSEFGDALAELLLGSEKVGSLFARALGRHEPGEPERLEKFVEKEGAAPLVEAYRREFHDPSSEVLTAVREKTIEALDRLGLRLTDPEMPLGHMRPLTPANLDGGGDADLRGADLQGALDDIDWSDQEAVFRPRFECTGRHHGLWREWFDDWSERLMPYVAELHERDETTDVPSEERLTRDLQNYVRERESPRLQFEPEEAVVRWLESRLETLPDELSATTLLERVRRYSPMYETVESVGDADEAGWERRTVEASGPDERERGTVDPDDIAREMAARSAVGDEAERALADRVAERTARLLERAAERGAEADAWEILLEVIPPNGATARNLHDAHDRWNKARTPRSLEAGFHIARIWDGAGYDVLGLDESPEGDLQAVRYEVKGLPRDGDVVKVHLTANELSVYRKVRLETDTADRYCGEWRLVGVEPSGTAIDLTDQLTDLPNLVADLRREGFDHDGLVLFVERGGSAG